MYLGFTRVEKSSLSMQKFDSHDTLWSSNTGFLAKDCIIIAVTVEAMAVVTSGPKSPSFEN